MRHKGTQLIETERLRLRRFRIEDAPAAYRNWTSDDRVTKFLRWQTHPDVETTERILREWIAAYADERFYQWAIELAGVGEPVGTISVVEQDEALSKLHIGYCIGFPWWGKGITTEAFRGLLPFLFEEVGANRIESQHDPNNPGSGRVMLKCGLRYEGTLREADSSNRGIVDAAMYSMLAKEYFGGTASRGD